MVQQWSTHDFIFGLFSSSFFSFLFCFFFRRDSFNVINGVNTSVSRTDTNGINACCFALQLQENTNIFCYFFFLVLLCQNTAMLRNCWRWTHFSLVSRIEMTWCDIWILGNPRNSECSIGANVVHGSYSRSNHLRIA